MTQLNANNQPPKSKASFTKKIKSTIYEVNVYFSDTSKETINDKIMRLLKREAAK
ncbi:MAG: transposon-encoded TnpW family protein [Oscillospiraceae bacterium]|jgi:hypothetical protein|nr:transposon-encoded TnpW family protein [Oscillospiraceae bacterium]